MNDKEKQIEALFNELMKLLVPTQEGSFGVRDVDISIALDTDTPIELRHVDLRVQGQWVDSQIYETGVDTTHRGQL